MGWKNMDVALVNEGAQNRIAFETEVNLAAAGSSDSIIVPDEVSGISATVEFTGGGTGHVETTTDKVSTVKAGTATWVAWDLGTVSTTKQDYCLPCTAIRATQVHAGAMKMSLRAQ